MHEYDSMASDIGSVSPSEGTTHIDDTKSTPSAPLYRFQLHPRKIAISTCKQPMACKVTMMRHLTLGFMIACWNPSQLLYISKSETLWHAKCY